MKNLLAQLKTEDWVIVLAGVAILALALLFPAGMPAMPKTLGMSLLNKFPRPWML